jgi:hypothetical protein
MYQRPRADQLGRLEARALFVGVDPRPSRFGTSCGIAGGELGTAAALSGGLATRSTPWLGGVELVALVHRGRRRACGSGGDRSWSRTERPCPTTPAARLISPSIRTSSSCCFVAAARRARSASGGSRHPQRARRAGSPPVSNRRSTGACLALPSFAARCRRLRSWSSIARTWKLRGRMQCVRCC